MTGHFDHTAFGRKIAFQNYQAAGGLERVAFYADDLLARRFFSLGSFFSERASRDGEAVATKQPCFKHALCEERSTACCV